MKINIHQQQDGVEQLEYFLDMIPNQFKQKFIVKEILQNNQIIETNMLRIHVLEYYKKENKSTFQFSDTILFNINRQEFDPNTFQIIKLNNDFKYDLIFNKNKNSSFSLPSCRQNDGEYILTFVMVHQGSGNSGHYYIYKLNLEQQHHYKNINQLKQQAWYKISDAKVEPVSRKEVLSRRKCMESAVILVYESVNKFINRSVTRNSMISVDHSLISQAKQTLKEMQTLSKSVQQLQLFDNESIKNGKGVQISFQNNQQIEIDKDTLISDFLIQKNIEINQLCIITKKKQFKTLNYYDKYCTIDDIFQYSDILKYKLFISQYQKRLIVSILISDTENNDNIISLEDYIIQLGEIEINDDMQQNIQILVQQYYQQQNQYINDQQNTYTYYLYKSGKILKIDKLDQQSISDNDQIIVQIQQDDFSSTSTSILNEQQTTQFSPKTQKQIHTIPKLFHEMQKRVKITFKIMPDSMIEAHKQSLRLIQLTFGGFDFNIYPQFLKRFQKKLQEYKQISDITLQVRYTDTLQSLMEQLYKQIDNMVALIFEDGSYIKYGEILEVLYYQHINIKEISTHFEDQQNGVVFMSNIQCNGRQLFINEPLQILSYNQRETQEQKSIGQYLHLVNSDTYDEVSNHDEDECPKLQSQKVNTFSFANQEIEPIVQVIKKEEQVIKQHDDEYIIFYRIPLVNYRLLQYVNVVRVVMVRALFPVVDLYVIVSRNINIASSQEILSNIQENTIEIQQKVKEISKYNVKIQLTLQSVKSDKLIFINNEQLISELRGSPMSQKWIFRCDLIDARFESNNLDYILIKYNDTFQGYPIIYDKNIIQTEEQMKEFINEQIQFTNELPQYVKELRTKEIKHSNHKFRNYFIHSKYSTIQWDQIIHYDQNLKKYYIECNQYTQVFQDNQTVQLAYPINSQEIQDFIK